MIREPKRNAANAKIENLEAIADEMLSALCAGERIRSRVLFNVSLMDKMPESANDMLGFVRADSVLKHKILTKATRQTASVFYRERRAPVVSKRFARYATAAACLLVMTITTITMLSGMFTPDAPNSLATGLTPTHQPSMKSFAAGDLLVNKLSLNSGVPEYNELLATLEDGQPALLSVNGRYYQMLAEPATVPSSYLGVKCGDVQPLTSDISLAGRIGVLSNVVNAGESVYAYLDYPTTTFMVANVDGAYRVFQRVAYASKALIGEETFADTLNVSGLVLAIELSGVGVVNDKAKADDLIDVLLANATEWTGDAIEGSQLLTIHLAGDVAVQLYVSGDVLEGCGTWSCPEFFEEFRKVI